MIFDDIQEMEEVIINDKTESIDCIRKMKDGFNTAYSMTRNRSERNFIYTMIELLDSFETTLESFPPPGRYRKVGEL